MWPFNSEMYWFPITCKFYLERCGRCEVRKSSYFTQHCNAWIQSSAGKVIVSGKLELNFLASSRCWSVKISVKYKNSGFKMFTCTLNTTKGSCDWKKQEEFRRHKREVMWHLPFRTSKEGRKNYESHKNACSGASLYWLCLEGITAIKGE